MNSPSRCGVSTSETSYVALKTSRIVILTALHLVFLTTTSKNLDFQHHHHRHPETQREHESIRDSRVHDVQVAREEAQFTCEEKEKS